MLDTQSQIGYTAFCGTSVQAERQQAGEQPLAGKLTGLKNRLLRPSSSSSPSSALPPQQPLVYDPPAPADAAYEHGTADGRLVDAQQHQQAHSQGQCHESLCWGGDILQQGPGC